MHDVKRATPEQIAAQRKRLEAYRERVRKPEIFQLDPVVAISLRGQEFKVEFDMKAAKDILKDCGFNLLSSSLFEVYENPDALGSILHRGLQRHHAEVSRPEADQLFTLRQHPYILSVLEEAATLFNPDLSDVPMPEGDEAPTPTDPPL